MKPGSGAILWLAFVLALILIVNGLLVGSVLEPTTIDPSAPRSTVTIHTERINLLTESDK
jgi:hypothetical protein